MPIEDRRRRIMTDCPDWGALPPSATAAGLRSHVDHRVPLQPRAEPLPSSSLISNYDNCASQLADFAGGMHETQHHSRYARVHVTTKSWSLDGLLSSSSNFHPVPRVPQYSHRLPDIIKEHEKNGIPYIIEKWNKHKNWERASFTLDHFAENTDSNISVRNVHDWTDKLIPFKEFLHKSRNAALFASPNESERLYGKDAACPSRWSKWLKNKTLPASLSPEGPDDILRYRPKEEPIETLMCYLGIGDTFTPCHKDLCASTGQNLMVYTEKNGSSYWFMTESSSAPEAELYFNSLREVLDHETHVITVEELAKAPFPIYIAEQKLGDLVLVPPRSCHQVVNAGGITIKASWSRMTLKGLETALYHELPLYRRVCRTETYRVKDTTHHALVKMTEELEQALDTHRRQDRESTSTMDPIDVPFEGPSLDREGFRKLLENVRFLIGLYRSILVEDSPPGSTEFESGNIYDIQYCDFCGADIFQTYFVCQEGCHSAAGECIICSGCYAEGRVCKCENMEPVQCRPFSDLLSVHEKAIKAYNDTVKQGICGDMKKIKSILPPGKHPRIFQAALILHGSRKQLKERKSTRDTKVCSHPKREPKHTVASHSTLFCKGCHAGKCFAHILSDHRLHAVRAVLLFNGNDDSRAYHEAHQKGKDLFDEAVGRIFECQKSGEKPDDGYLLLVHNALTFRTCKPIYPSHLKPGWYDMKTLVVNYSPIVEDSLHGASSVTEASSSRGVSPVNVETSPRKTPRAHNLAFVLVPLASYRAPSQQKQQGNARINAAATASSPTHVRPTRRKSMTDAQYVVAEDVTTIANPLETQLETSVSSPSRKRKRQEVEQPISAEKTDMGTNLPTLSLEDALNGAGSINGILPTESDEDHINRAITQKPRVQSDLQLRAKKRLPKSPRIPKAKTGASARSHEGETNDTTTEVPSIDEITPMTKVAALRRKLPGRKGVSRAPVPKPKSVRVPRALEADARRPRQRKSVGFREHAGDVAETAQIRPEPLHGEQEENEDDMSPSRPDHSEFVEGSSRSFNLNQANVPTRLRKQPRFANVDEYHGNHVPEIPTSTEVENMNSEQQSLPPTQLGEQSVSQLNAHTNLSGNTRAGNDSVLQLTSDQLLEFGKSIVLQTTESMTQMFLKAINSHNTSANGQNILPQPPGAAGRDSQPMHATASTTQTSDANLKGIIIEVLKELSEQGRTSPVDASIGHTQARMQRDDNIPYNRYEPSASMVIRANERGESSRYHHGDGYNQRPNNTPRNNYHVGNKSPYHMQRPYNRHYNFQQNKYAAGNNNLQRLQWDRHDDRSGGAGRVTSRYQPYKPPYDNKRVTRSATRRQETRTEHSPDSPRHNYERARSRSPSSNESVQERRVPEGRVTRSSTAAAAAAAATSRHEHRERPRARTPPGEPPSFSQSNRTINDEDRQGGRRVNEERHSNRRSSMDDKQNNRKATIESARDPQDWEDEYAQEEHNYRETTPEYPDSRNKRALGRLSQTE